MKGARAILHVGAPKCGSSSLQALLSTTPDHTDRDGTRVRYTGCLNLETGWSPLLGADVTRTALASPFGYASWPDIDENTPADRVTVMIGEMLTRAGADGYVPILSCEGWINRHAAFAGAMRGWGYPLLQVVAFLRPPVTWVNSAYWQWGVWNVASCMDWLGRGGQPYDFGASLAAWAQIPNVRLSVRPAAPDIVAGFADVCGVDLHGQTQRNAAIPPALIGFLLRNRRFRPTPHDAAVEFVVQRWCPTIPGPKAWALSPGDLPALLRITERNRCLLERILPGADFTALMADRGWNDDVIAAAVARPKSALDDRKELVALHDALRHGVAGACRAAGQKVQPANTPAETASLEDWDDAVARQLDALIEVDRDLRSRHSPKAPAPQA